MSITQRHIADALNLSIITVSRALRDHPDLAAETKSRVLNKARELGYKKFKSIQPGQESRRIGILFYQDTPNEDPLRSDIRRAIFLALQRECQSRNFETLVETLTPDEVPLFVRNRRVEGAFLFGRYTPETITRLEGIPLLAVSSFITCEDLPRIVANNLGGIKLVTEHLIELGHRDILFLSNQDTLTQIFEERADGYTIAMHRAGLLPRYQFFQGAEIPDVDVTGCSAVVCSSDSLAFELREKLLEQDIKVPDHLSLVGFDDLARTHGPCVTTYAPDWVLMGRLAADLLLTRGDAIQGRNITVTVPGKVVYRDTTAPHRS
jgi:LacI family transcriptional regulator